MICRADPMNLNLIQANQQIMMIFIIALQQIPQQGQIIVLREIFIAREIVQVPHILILMLIPVEFVNIVLQEILLVIIIVH